MRTPQPFHEPHSARERRVRFLPLRYPLWAEMTVASLFGSTVGLIVGYLLVLVISGGTVDSVGWAFVGAIVLAGIGAGVWNTAPNRGRRELGAIAVAIVVALAAYSVVERERFSYKRGSPQGPAVASVGMVVLVVAGVGMPSVHFRRQPRDKWDNVVGVLIALIFVIAFVAASGHLWMKYG